MDVNAVGVEMSRLNAQVRRLNHMIDELRSRAEEESKKTTEGLQRLINKHRGTPSEVVLHTVAVSARVMGTSIDVLLLVDTLAEYANAHAASALKALKMDTRPAMLCADCPAVRK